MMASMIEHIARAVAIATDEETAARASIGQEPYIQDKHRKVAKAVLEAMRGQLPTEMISAGLWVQDHCSDVDQIFAEMIRGALYPEDIPPHRLA